MGRLIVVSNRLPFTLEKGELRQSSGGLVSALKSYFERSGEGSAYSGRIWLGSMDATAEDWERVKNEGKLPKDFGIEPLFPEKDIYERYYNGFSNSTLWPLFHYFPMIADYAVDAYEAYEQVNRQFAARIVDLYEEGDTIWVHDYQLMLLPGLLRDKLPEATIGFFLHIPFPSWEVFRLLPRNWKKALLEGMLGADLIGFHTHDYVQHFIQSAKMVLQIEHQFNSIHYNNRLIRADLFPIGIDYGKFRDALFNDLSAHISQGLEEKFFRQKIIFSVDRLDYTKGLNYRLTGFEAFLEKYPQWREKVVFIFNIIPSRDSIHAYAERRRAIEEQVSSINGKFASLHWQPVMYRYNHLSFEELCALYQSADVALITPLRDGMNLVAKEYIASCLDKGVLILSELTGAASELNEALLVNPTDTEEVADAIQTALAMPAAEQVSRLHFMQRRIAAYDVHKWINDFIDVMQHVKMEQEERQANLLDGAVVREIMDAFHAAGKRCLLLDYDGTLVPIQKRPEQAVPSQEMLQVIRALAEDRRNEIVIISGRDKESLQTWLGDLHVTLVAEHGACLRHKGGEWQEQLNVSGEWKDQVRPMLDLFVTRCVGSFVEEKGATLAWHYRATHPDLGFNRSRELLNSLLQLTANMPLQVVDGNKVIEIRMMGVDKGSIAQRLIDNMQPSFILCIGDDTTDEDMFRSLKDHAYTIKVGNGNTAARYTMYAQTQVLPLLRRFQSAETTVR